MTSLQIVSDLHIEFKNNDVPNPLDLITPTADVLILAGDIGSFYKIDQLRAFLEKLCPLFQIILYVPGNCEYYTVPGDSNFQNMNQLLDRLYTISKGLPNLYVLDKSSVKIGNVCIAGCTLWSEPKIEVPSYIVRVHKMNTAVYKSKHESELKYVKKMIKYCREKKHKLIVVTHHCPTYRVLDGARKREKLYSLYASHLDELLRKEYVDTWVCGHTHKNFDLVTNDGTRVVSNQKGKPKDRVLDYSKEFVITV